MINQIDCTHIFKQDPKYDEGSASLHSLLKFVLISMSVQDNLDVSNVPDIPFFPSFSSPTGEC